jgi:prepilin-type N-terminal cleavage/methylation domain-containing protein
MKRNAFTLIELLVVMSIIGLLAGLIFPAISRSKEMAKKTKAKAQIKQLDIAFRAVQNDFHGWSALSSSLGVGGGLVNAAVVDFLKGNNTRGAIYMEFDNSSTNSAGEFIDTWDRAYKAALSSAGSITPPHGQVYRQIGVWSRGGDGKDSTPAEQKDDLTSWQ